jgi:hypothetical protein
MLGGVPGRQSGGSGTAEGYHLHGDRLLGDDVALDHDGYVLMYALAGVVQSDSGKQRVTFSNDEGVGTDP